MGLQVFSVSLSFPFYFSSSIIPISLFTAFKYAIMLASITFVERPLPVMILSSDLIFTITSPKASFPSDVE